MDLASMVVLAQSLVQLGALAEQFISDYNNGISEDELKTRFAAMLAHSSQISAQLREEIAKQSSKT